MNKYFSAKASLILSWLNAKGYSGSLADAFNQYVQEYSGLARGTFFDHLDKALSTTGYEGTLEDKLTTMFILNTRQSHRKDAEREFFQDGSMEMFLNPLMDDDGNLVKDDDGKQIYV